MRRLKITHLTEYRFFSPVTLQTHRLLLRPREGPEIHIENSLLEIFPACHIKWQRDALDNAAAVVDFQESAQTLSINSEVILQLSDQSPLDFLVADYAVNYPFHYAPHDRVDLQPFLQPAYLDEAESIRNWLYQLGLGQPAMQTYSLLDQLSRTIAGQFAYTVRDEPGVQSPAQTLAWGSGSCRDFAALFMDVCRYLGLASRFVSGYAHAPDTEHWSTTTHAWAEVYLPGPGWKGFDPTGGELTGGRHIPVAVSRHPETVPPVAGSFIGLSGATPTLIVDVRVVAM
jgi:transglutaminase-like putative cysteine protease